MTPAPGVAGVAVLVAVVFAVLSLLHVAWAVGLRVGSARAIPERDGVPLFEPGPFATLAVAALLLLAALVVTQRAGLGRTLLPAPLVGPGCWAVSVALVARAVGEFRFVGFFKRVRDTEFARMDSRYYSPLAFLLGVGAGLVALLAS